MNGVDPRQSWFRAEKDADHHTNLRTALHTDIYTKTNTLTDMNKLAQTHTHTHEHTHARTHTRTHTHTHTHTQPKKESNWRAKREEFIRNIRYARGAAKGGDAGPPPPPTVNPDYVQCPHCERRFNEAAAERHIPKCQDLKTKSVGQKSAVGNSARTLSKPPSNTRRR